MKSHKTKEECLENFIRNNPKSTIQDAFIHGWYAAGNEINEGEDSDWLQESLIENDFLLIYSDETDEYKVISVSYTYRQRIDSCGCCSWDDSTCCLQFADGTVLDLEEFGAVYDEKHMQYRLAELGYICSDSCDFSNCSYC